MGCLRRLNFVQESKTLQETLRMGVDPVVEVVEVVDMIERAGQ